MDFSVDGLAARQLADYRAHTPGTFFAEEDHPRLTLDDAYAIQAEVASLRAAEGEPVAGYKVGATGAGVRGGGAAGHRRGDSCSLNLASEWTVESVSAKSLNV